MADYRSFKEIKNRYMRIMLAFLREANTARSVTETINALYERLNKD